MPQRVIIDAGPIVGYFIESDAHHDWSVRQFLRFSRFLTCEAVLAEACARLAYFRLDQCKVIDLLNTGSLVVDFDLMQHADRVARLMKKYADQPMDFADACLVTMTERFSDSLVVTLDAQDFSVYRRHERETVPFDSPTKA
jgi:predicted nucleic acid-binding protein